MERPMPILPDSPATERVGFLVAVGTFIGGAILAIGKLLQFLFHVHGEHEQLMVHLAESKEMLPRFIATEEAVEYLKKTQQEQLAELRGIRSDLSSLTTALIKKMEE